MLTTSLDWMNRAACQGKDWSIWFPDPSQEKVIAMAKRICAHCVVRKQCLEYALWRESGTARRSRYGIWGGLTPEERQELDIETQT